MTSGSRGGAITVSARPCQMSDSHSRRHVLCLFRLILLPQRVQFPM
jgi:hypothetical protein